MTSELPTDTIRRRNPRHQGEIGLGDAIGWFTAHGWRVCVPLADNQEYDLVVQEWPDAALARVQVKTTTRRNARGRFEVMIETAGGNRSGTTRKLFDPGLVDLLYVLTDERARYLIPADRIEARRHICLGDKWSPYRV